jgi:hypothetical protein
VAGAAGYPDIRYVVYPAHRDGTPIGTEPRLRHDFGCSHLCAGCWLSLRQIELLAGGPAAAAMLHAAGVNLRAAGVTLRSCADGARNRLAARHEACQRVWLPPTGDRHHLTGHRRSRVSGQSQDLALSATATKAGRCFSRPWSPPVLSGFID